MIYQSLRELGNNTLNYDDVVYFYVDDKQLKYYIQPNYLSNALKCDNAEIFSILGINKSDFCNTFYGYHNHGGDWPTCKLEDFAALTRVVQALYREIEHKEARENIVHSYDKNLIQELKTSLSDTLPMSLLTTSSVLEKKENTSSNIITKRKSKVKRIIGEESIKLNNY